MKLTIHTDDSSLLLTKCGPLVKILILLFTLVVNAGLIFDPV